MPGGRSGTHGSGRGAGGDIDCGGEGGWGQVRPGRCSGVEGVQKVEGCACRETTQSKASQSLMLRLILSHPGFLPG